jgi:acyl-CoA thioester hydrolase, YbgC/YbaW family
MAESFIHKHRVTYSDCTVGNHIYYGRYLDLLEAARGELFRHAGITFISLQEQDFIFPVIECRLRYKAPARYDDVLLIETWLTEAQKVRLNFAYRITTEAGRLILEAETQHVCTGTEEKLKRMPDDLVMRLQPFLKAAG